MVRKWVLLSQTAVEDYVANVMLRTTYTCWQEMPRRAREGPNYTPLVQTRPLEPLVDGEKAALPTKPSIMAPMILDRESPFRLRYLLC